MAQIKKMSPKEIIMLDPDEVSTNLATEKLMATPKGHHEIALKFVLQFKSDLTDETEAKKKDGASKEQLAKFREKKLKKFRDKYSQNFEPDQLETMTQEVNNFRTQLKEHNKTLRETNKLKSTELDNQIEEISKMSALKTNKTKAYLKERGYKFGGKGKGKKTQKKRKKRV
jgi:ribosomal protein S15P/S13E